MLRRTGCYELAIIEGEKAVKLSGGSPLMRAALASTLGAAGRATEAHQMLEDLTHWRSTKYVAPTSLRESTSAWEKTIVRWNTWRNATKSTPTG